MALLYFVVAIGFLYIRSMVDFSTSMGVSIDCYGIG
jgi:hypothetical protein